MRSCRTWTRPDTSNADLANHRSPPSIVCIICLAIILSSLQARVPESRGSADPVQGVVDQSASVGRKPLSWGAFWEWRHKFTSGNEPEWDCVEEAGKRTWYDSLLRLLAFAYLQLLGQVLEHVYEAALTFLNLLSDFSTVSERPT